MKIVKSSNFDDELYAESFLDLPHLTPIAASTIAQVINRYCSTDTSRDYWKVVDNDYKLQTGDPNENR